MFIIEVLCEREQIAYAGHITFADCREKALIGVTLTPTINPSRPKAPVEV